MKFISRDDLGWPATAARVQPFDPRGVKVHYEGDAFPGFDHSRCPAHWTEIRNSHLANKEENYSDVAYNLAVCQHGYILEGRGAGHQTGANGNQELNRNHYAVVVLIGGGTQPTSDAVRALKEAIQYLRDRGAGNEIKGHRDGYATSCPGEPLYNLVRSGSLEPDSEEDDMPSPEEIFNYKVPIGGNEDYKVSIADILAWTDNRHNVIYNEVEAIKAQLVKILAILKP